MSTSSVSKGIAPAYTAEDTQTSWGLLRKIAFRFLFCYIVLFGFDCLNFVRELLVYQFTGRFPASPVDRLWGVVVPWIARYLFHLKAFTYQPIDSGDSVSDYVRLVASVLIAAIAAAVWSLVDSKRANHARLNQWLRLYAQFVLALVMFTYGFDKVIPLQFGELTPSRLSAQVGDLTQFSMLWVFMASSKPYTIFSGVLEVLSGVLLLIPKLRALGALLLIAVMTNVFVLNLFYDVPVKSFSFELLLLGIFLASPEFSRLVKMLVFNRAVEPRRETALSDKPPVVRWAYIAQGTIGCCVFLLEMFGSANLHARDTAAVAAVPLYGIWKMDEFKVLDDSQAPLFTDKLATQMHLKPGEDRWTQLIFERAGSVLIQLQNGTLDQVNIAFSKDKTHADLSDLYDPKWKAQLEIQQPEKKFA